MDRRQNMTRCGRGASNRNMQPETLFNHHNSRTLENDISFIKKYWRVINNQDNSNRDNLYSSNKQIVQNNDNLFGRERNFYSTDCNNCQYDADDNRHQPEGINISNATGPLTGRKHSRELERNWAPDRLSDLDCRQLINEQKSRRHDWGHYLSHQPGYERRLCDQKNHIPPIHQDCCSPFFNQDIQHQVDRQIPSLLNCNHFNNPYNTNDNKLNRFRRHSGQSNSIYKRNYFLSDGRSERSYPKNEVKRCYYKNRVVRSSHKGESERGHHKNKSHLNDDNSGRGKKENKSPRSSVVAMKKDGKWNCSPKAVDVNEKFLVHETQKTASILNKCINNVSNTTKAFTKHFVVADTNGSTETDNQCNNINVEEQKNKTVNTSQSVMECESKLNKQSIISENVACMSNEVATNNIGNNIGDAKCCVSSYINHKNIAAKTITKQVDNETKVDLLRKSKMKEIYHQTGIKFADDVFLKKPQGQEPRLPKQMKSNRKNNTDNISQHPDVECRTKRKNNERCRQKRVIDEYVVLDEIIENDVNSQTETESDMVEQSITSFKRAKNTAPIKPCIKTPIEADIDVLISTKTCNKTALSNKDLTKTLIVKNEMKSDESIQSLIDTSSKTLSIHTTTSSKTSPVQTTTLGKTFCVNTATTTTSSKTLCVDTTTSTLNKTLSVHTTTSSTSKSNQTFIDATTCVDTALSDSATKTNKTSDTEVDFLVHIDLNHQSKFSSIGTLQNINKDSSEMLQVPHLLSANSDSQAKPLSKSLDLNSSDLDLNNLDNTSKSLPYNVLQPSSKVCCLSSVEIQKIRAKRAKHILCCETKTPINKNLLNLPFVDLTNTSTVISKCFPSFTPENQLPNVNNIDIYTKCFDNKDFNCLSHVEDNKRECNIDREIETLENTEGIHISPSNKFCTRKNDEDILRKENNLSITKDNKSDDIKTIVQHNEIKRCSKHKTLNENNFKNKRSKMENKLTNNLSTAKRILSTIEKESSQNKTINDTSVINNMIINQLVIKNRKHSNENEDVSIYENDEEVTNVKKRKKKKAGNKESLKNNQNKKISMLAKNNNETDKAMVTNNGDRTVGNTNTKTKELVFDIANVNNASSHGKVCLTRNNVDDCENIKSNHMATTSNNKATSTTNTNNASISANIVEVIALASNGSSNNGKVPISFRTSQTTVSKSKVPAEVSTIKRNVSQCVVSPSVSVVENDVCMSTKKAANFINKPTMCIDNSNIIVLTGNIMSTCIGKGRMPVTDGKLSVDTKNVAIVPKDTSDTTKAREHVTSISNENVTTRNGPINTVTIGNDVATADHRKSVTTDTKKGVATETKKDVAGETKKGITAVAAMTKHTTTEKGVMIGTQKGATIVTTNDALADINKSIMIDAEKVTVNSNKTILFNNSSACLSDSVGDTEKVSRDMYTAECIENSSVNSISERDVTNKRIENWNTSQNDQMLQTFTEDAWSITNTVKLLVRKRPHLENELTSACKEILTEFSACVKKSVEKLNNSNVM